jgi:hypothetical protein
MLGHKSAKVTLDSYADLFDDDLDAVAVSLHARYSTRGNCVSPKLHRKLWPKCGYRASQQTRNTDLSGQILLPHECGRRDSNPHALSSTGT